MSWASSKRSTFFSTLLTEDRLLAFHFFLTSWTTRLTPVTGNFWTALPYVRRHFSNAA